MVITDLFKNLVSVLSIIVLIIVSRRVLRILGKAIEGEIAADTILSVVGLKMLIATVMFLPPALFLAVLMVLGRMYRDNEIAALAVAGLGVSRLYRSVMLFMVPLALFSGYLSLYVMPWSEARIEQIFQMDEESANLRGLSAGRFSEYSHGDIVVYVEDISEDRTMRNLFVQSRREDKVGIINAKKGYIDDLPGGRYVILKQGERVEGRPGDQDFTLLKFDEYAVRIEERKTVDIKYDREAVPSNVLWGSSVLRDIAELQRRLAIPIGILVLGILAVPLAQVAPRGGVYGNLITAFLIYVIYGNLLHINHSWVVKGIIPVWLGYSWVYLLGLITAGVLVMKAIGREWLLRVVSGKVAI
ncbi:MAG: LPS export ABC transporter permease LptF [Pseudomonadota bacterium]